MWSFSMGSQGDGVMLWTSVDAAGLDAGIDSAVSIVSGTAASGSAESSAGGSRVGEL
jgi:hypothetical protein